VTRIVESVGAGTATPIELELGTDLPEISVDPDKFTQVVTNLVENGVRHGDGTVRVAVLTSTEGEWPGVEVRVDDEGTGIPADLRRRVFTKFWKGGVRGGSGLGLYIVHGLVRAHGGSVVITDAPTGGARIVTYWPTDDHRQE
jgi:signal transduction histidine kinase